MPCVSIYLIFHLVTKQCVSLLETFSECLYIPISCGFNCLYMHGTGTMEENTWESGHN